MNPFRIILKGWRVFSHTLGRINTFVILSAIYIVLFGIYFLVRFLIRLPKFLAGKRGRQTSSYWNEKRYIEPTLETAERQFS